MTTKTIPTEEQIAAEIAWLKANRELVRRRPMWGGDNWALVDVQIWVLTERPSDFQIERRYDDLTAEEVPPAYYTAIDAHYWLIGDNADPPSKDWRPLLTGPEVEVPRAGKEPNDG